MIFPEKINFLFIITIIISSLSYLSGMQGPFYLDKIVKYSQNNHHAALPVEKIRKLFVLSKPLFENAHVITDIDDFYLVAQDVHKALVRCHKHYDQRATATLSHLVNEEKIKETLAFVMRLIERDREQNRPYRLKNPDFLAKNFHYLFWKSDITSSENVIQSSGNDAIRLTHYAIFHAEARREKSKKFCAALYQIIDPSVAPEYTKQQIMEGVLELPTQCHRVMPLAWLTREKFEEALFQGAVLVTFPDGNQQLFNVHTHNNKKYDKKIADRKKQRRYWYFSPIIHTEKLFEKIRARAGILCAGDIWSLGFGRLFLLSSWNKESNERELRLALLADFGAAFAKNGYQLDMFAGIFSHRSQFNEYVKTQPMFARTYTLYR